MSLALELEVIKNNLKATGINVVVKKNGRGNPKYIGFKDKEGKLIRIGIYLHDGRTAIETWGIRKGDRRVVSDEGWIDRLDNICIGWNDGWQSEGTQLGGYPSKMKYIDGMELYEIIGELYKFM
jgi:hypothetical protein